jgi:hypothetical protein
VSTKIQDLAAAEAIVQAELKTTKITKERIRFGILLFNLDWFDVILDSDISNTPFYYFF